MKINKVGNGFGWPGDIFWKYGGHYKMDAIGGKNSNNCKMTPLQLHTKEYLNPVLVQISTIALVAVELIELMLMLQRLILVSTYFSISCVS